jgi:hypothetical protein
MMTPAPIAKIGHLSVANFSSALWGGGHAPRVLPRAL